MNTTEEQIAKIEREIERLKNLPPSTTRRRAGSGNLGREAVIARWERQLKILRDQMNQQGTAQHG